MDSDTSAGDGKIANLFFTVCSCSYFRLILPALGSSRIYVVDCKTDPRNPKLDKVRKKYPVPVFNW